MKKIGTAAFQFFMAAAAMLLWMTATAGHIWAAEQRSSSAAVEPVSVKAAILLSRDGETRQVPTDFAFRPGDRIKLLYVASMDCFAYWLAESRDGSSYLLFPNRLTGLNNTVRKNERNIVPENGSFLLNDYQGPERLTLVLAHDRVPGLEQAARHAGSEESSGTGKTRSKQPGPKSGSRPFYVTFELRRE